MITVKEAVELANNIVNPSDAEQLKNYIYELQKENIDLKSQLVECKSKLQVAQEWSNTKSLYQECQTGHGAILYRKIKEIIADAFYCPVCFAKQLIIPLQPMLSSSGFTDPTIAYENLDEIKRCPSCDNRYFI